MSNPNVPAMQNPAPTLESLCAVLTAMKQGLESLAGSRGRPENQAVTFKDLMNAGLIGTDNTIAASTVSRKVLAKIGDGTQTAFTISHTLKTTDLIISARRGEAPYDLLAFTASPTTDSTVRIVFNAPTNPGMAHVILIG